MLPQTQKLVSIFNEEQFNNVKNIIEEIERDIQDYKTINMWKFDQTIGGIGGYCQGCDPAKSNPFQGTEFRNAYRCLQYIRSDFDLCNINDVARYTIENCGHHLEEGIKLYLKKNKTFNWIRTIRYPLGKLLQYVTDKQMSEEKVINELRLFIELYNISKHEILSNDELDRTFHADDAIICYFACRIVGKEILLKIDVAREQQIYEINWRKYNRTINHF